MFHVKFQDHETSGSEVEEFLKILAIYGHGSHLGHDQFYKLMSILLKEDPHKNCLYCVCSTVSSMLSGLETRSLGLNTLGTT